MLLLFYKESPSKSLARTLVAIHRAFDELRQELALFSRFTQTNFCDIIDLIHKQTNGSPTINLCYMAARHVNSKLSEEPSTQMDKKKWLDWFARINHASALIQRFVNTCAPTTAVATTTTTVKDVGDQYENLDEFRLLWQRVSLTKCYIEHLWLKNQSIDNMDMIYKRCILFWNAFKTGFDLAKSAKPSPFESLVKWLRLLDSVIRNSLLKVKCAYCNINTYQRMYRLQPCACVVCEKCETKLTSKCQNCSKNVTSHDLVQDELGLKPYNTFKSSLNDFITDVIANICLDTRMSARPSKEALNSMIELLMPASKEQLVAEDQLFNFSLNPSAKSTLFQLLLNHDEAEMESYLDEVLSAKFLKQESYDNDDLINLQLMYLNAIEDSMYSKS